MSARRVTVTFTEAQAWALFGFAIEGELDAQGRGADEGSHPSSHRAGKRAMEILRDALPDEAPWGD